MVIIAIPANTTVTARGLLGAVIACGGDDLAQVVVVACWTAAAGGREGRCSQSARGMDEHGRATQRERSRVLDLAMEHRRTRTVEERVSIHFCTNSPDRRHMRGQSLLCGRIHRQRIVSASTLGQIHDLPDAALRLSASLDALSVLPTSRIKTVAAPKMRKTR